MNELALIDSFFNDVPSFHVTPFRRGKSTVDAMVTNTRCDFVDNGDKYMLHAELPGVKKEEININIDEGVLTLEANKSEDVKVEKSNYYHRERSWGKVQRSFRLPRDAGVDNPNVSFTDGVLSITFPKVAKAGAKKLTIA